MNSRILVNLGLFVFLAVAITFFITKKNAPNNTQFISTLKLENIQRIYIPRSKNRSIEFIKNKLGIWYIQTPFSIKAHQFRVQTLLNLTQLPIDKSYAIDTLTLADYGLSPPRARIIFNDVEITFGKINSINNKRYLLAENKMFMLQERLYPLVSAQAVSFIDLALLPDDIKITKIQTPNVTIQKSIHGKSAHEKWVSTGKRNLNADQIQALLQNWTLSKAYAIHKYMPRKQLGQLRVSDTKNTLTYEITEDDSVLILALPSIGIEYHLDISLKNNLFGLPEKDLDHA